MVIYKLTPQASPVRTLPDFWDNEKIAEYYSLCVDILKAEIDFFQTKHLLFITGASYFRPVELGSSYDAVISMDEDPDKNTFSIIGKRYYTDSTGRKVKADAANQSVNYGGKYRQNMGSV